MQLIAALLTSTLASVTFANPTLSGPGATNIAAADADVRALLGFSNTCSNIDLIGGGAHLVLSADCETSPLGTPRRNARIELNDCYANNDGALQCQALGNALSSCRNCELVPAGSTFMTCECRTATGTAAFPTVNLDECVRNILGELVCG